MQFRLVVHDMYAYSKVVSGIFFFEKVVHGPKKIENY